MGYLFPGFLGVLSSLTGFIGGLSEICRVLTCMCRRSYLVLSARLEGLWKPKVLPQTFNNPVLKPYRCSEKRHLGSSLNWGLFLGPCYGGAALFGAPKRDPNLENYRFRCSAVEKR